MLAETDAELQTQLEAIPPARLAMWFVYGHHVGTPRLLMEQVAPELRTE